MLYTAVCSRCSRILRSCYSSLVVQATVGLTRTSLDHRAFREMWDNPSHPPRPCPHRASRTTCVGLSPRSASPITPTHPHIFPSTHCPTHPPTHPPTHLILDVNVPLAVNRVVQCCQESGVGAFVFISSSKVVSSRNGLDLSDENVPFVTSQEDETAHAIASAEAVALNARQETRRYLRCTSRLLVFLRRFFFFFPSLSSSDNVSVAYVHVS